MRLIDADALMDSYGMSNDCDKCEHDARDCRYKNDYSLMDFCSMIEDQPTIDAVPVIRCKDCRHYALLDYGSRETWMCGLLQYVCDDTDYCSMAEKSDADD